MKTKFRRDYSALCQVLPSPDLQRKSDAGVAPCVRINRPHPACKTATVCLSLMLTFLHCSNADTLVQGAVSGVWSNALSPYRLIENCTVPSGQTLTIEPGVVVKFDSGFSLNVYGTIIAEGTHSARIQFRSRLASEYWHQIFIQYGGGADSRFAYCNFRDATNAICVGIYYVTATMAPKFENCTFSNCVKMCIRGEACARVTVAINGVFYHQPTLNLRVVNSRFQICEDAISVYTVGHRCPNSPDVYYAYAWANPTIANNIFDTLSGTAVQLYPDSYTGGSSARIMNNLFKQCPRALVSADPYDCQVNNNIFQECGVAIQKSGSLSLDTRYNCFFRNQTNLLGYSSPAYGRFDDTNTNGTPADAFMNIASDPMYAETTCYTLSGSSPCIDAGNPDSAFNDMCFPPSQGGVQNDIGAYGGPGACACHFGVPPSIVRQPQSQQGCLGQNATFSVSAAGTLPPAYQWWFEDAPMPEATNALLTITNVRSGDAGRYTAVVSNAAGSVTSAPALFAVRDACIDIRCVAGVWIWGEIGATYVLKYTTDIANTNFATWTPLATNTMTISPWYFVDMDSPFSPKRFYAAERQR